MRARPSLGFTTPLCGTAARTRCRRWRAGQHLGIRCARAGVEVATAVLRTASMSARTRGSAAERWRMSSPTHSTLAVVSYAAQLGACGSMAPTADIFHLLTWRVPSSGRLTGPGGATSAKAAHPHRTRAAQSGMRVGRRHPATRVMRSWRCERAIARSQVAVKLAPSLTRSHSDRGAHRRRMSGGHAIDAGLRATTRAYATIAELNRHGAGRQLGDCAARPPLRCLPATAQRIHDTGAVPRCAKTKLEGDRQL